MHSHDRTLLSKLGFGDVDRKNKDHELACLYLSQRDIGRQLVSRLCGDDDSLDIENSAIEVALSKGEGQYKTTIGFLDVRIDFSYIRTCKPSCCSDSVHICYGVAIIEVKNAVCDVSEIIRQINLYKAHFQCVHYEFWIVATTYNISALDSAALTAAGLRHVFLGKGFRSWCEANAGVASSVVEI